MKLTRFQSNVLDGFSNSGLSSFLFPFGKGRNSCLFKLNLHQRIGNLLSTLELTCSALFHHLQDMSSMSSHVPVEDFNRVSYCLSIDIIYHISYIIHHISHIILGHLGLFFKCITGPQKNCDIQWLPSVTP